MGQKELTLEQRTETPDWKQWIPVYGIVRAEVDARKGKSSIGLDSENHPLRFLGSALYHATTTVGIFASAGYILYEALK